MDKPTWRIMNWHAIADAFCWGKKRKNKRLGRKLQGGRIVLLVPKWKPNCIKHALQAHAKSRMLYFTL
jgi:hypothetical protein